MGKFLYRWLLKKVGIWFTSLCVEQNMETENIERVYGPFWDDCASRLQHRRHRINETVKITET